MKNRNRFNKTKLLAVCSMFSALGVVILYMGALIEVLDLTMAFIASLIVMAAVIELGGAYPWLIYAVTGTIALLLVPNKFCAVVYFGFVGFYPILKEKFERVPGVACLVMKIASFNLCMLAMWGITQLLSLPVTFGFPIWVVALVLNAVFVVFDVALTRVITMYVCRWRMKLKIDKWLK